MSYQPKFLPKLDEFIKLIKLWESNPNVSVRVQPRADFDHTNIYLPSHDFDIIQHYLPKYFGKQVTINGYSPHIDYTKPIHFGKPSDDSWITSSDQYNSASSRDSSEASAEMSLYKSDSAKQSGMLGQSNPSNQGDNQ